MAAPERDAVTAAFQRRGRSYERLSEPASRRLYDACGSDAEFEGREEQRRREEEQRARRRGGGGGARDGEQLMLQGGAPPMPRSPVRVTAAARSCTLVRR